MRDSVAARAEMADGARLTSTSDSVAAAPAEPAGGTCLTSLTQMQPLPSWQAAMMLFCFAIKITLFAKKRHFSANHPPPFANLCGLISLSLNLTVGIKTGILSFAHKTNIIHSLRLSMQNVSKCFVNIPSPKSPIAPPP